MILIWYLSWLTLLIGLYFYYTLLIHRCRFALSSFPSLYRNCVRVGSWEFKKKLNNTPLHLLSEVSGF